MDESRPYKLFEISPYKKASDTPPPSEQPEEVIIQAIPENVDVSLAETFNAYNTGESAQPALSPEKAEEKDKDFSVIRQGTSTNALAKIGNTESRGLTFDRVTGDPTITSGDFSLTIAKYGEIRGEIKGILKTSARQLLDALIIALNERGARQPEVTLPLSDYMKRRGLKDRKEAKAQAITDIKILSRAQITWTEKKGKKTDRFSFVNLADSGDVLTNGDITFTFGNTFYSVISEYPPMPYPNLLQRLNSKKNPHSYYLLRKIAEHKNMNIGKKNEDIIAVKTLLEATHTLPTYKEVMESDRHLDQRIITPFQRDMDALSDILGWEYCHSNNTPLTDEECATLDYKLFETLLVHITWYKYPDQTARREKLAEARATAQSKKRARNKKNSLPKE